MECRSVPEYLSDTLDGTLTDTDLLKELQAHLDVCARCGREYAGMQLLEQVVHTLPVPAPDNDYWDALGARIRRQAAHVAVRRRWRRIVSSAAAVIMVGLIATAVTRYQRDVTGPAPVEHEVPAGEETAGYNRGLVRMTVEMGGLDTPAAKAIKFTEVMDVQLARMVAAADAGAGDQLGAFAAAYRRVAVEGILPAVAAAHASGIDTSEITAVMQTLKVNHDRSLKYILTKTDRPACVHAAIDAVGML